MGAGTGVPRTRLNVARKGAVMRHEVEATSVSRWWRSIAASAASASSDAPRPATRDFNTWVSDASDSAIATLCCSAARKLAAVASAAAARAVSCRNCRSLATARAVAVRAAVRSAAMVSDEAGPSPPPSAREYSSMMRKFRSNSAAC